MENQMPILVPQPQNDKSMRLFNLEKQKIKWN